MIYVAILLLLLALKMFISELLEKKKSLRNQLIAWIVLIISWIIIYYTNKGII
jgi:hypothetical protein